MRDPAKGWNTMTKQEHLAAYVECKAAVPGSADSILILFTHEQRDTIVSALRALSPPEPTEVRRLVDEQARDEGLWFQAQTCAEAYVQTALRKLHAAVEGDKSVILPARVMALHQETKP